MHEIDQFGTRRSVIPYLLLIVIGAILYVPFGAKTLYHLDSVGFALSIHQFNLALHQPGGTGYPLYVLALRAIKWLTDASDVDCIVALSIVATLVATMLFYTMVKSWTSAGRAFQTAVLLLTSPVIWFNADIPMSYPTGLLSSVAVAFVALRLTQGAVSARHALPVVWGITAGFRPDVGVMAAPLAISCAWREFRKSTRYGLEFLALATFAAGVWFVPLVLKSGGLLAYLDTVRGTLSAVSPVSLLLRGAPLASLELTLKNVAIVGVFLFLGAIGAILLRTYSSRRPPPGVCDIPGFLMMWAVPGILVHALTTVGHSGYLLPYLPPVLLLVATRSGTVAEPPNGLTSPPWAPGLFGSAVALQAVLFLLMPQQEGMFSGHWAADTLFRGAILEPTRSRIQRYDATIESLVGEIRKNYPRDTTWLIVPVADELPNGPPVRPLYAQARYYLPGWEQRVLYTAPLEVLKSAGISAPAIAEVTSETFNLVNTNIVVIPRDIRSLVWFCDARVQPYRFDHSWVRYAVGPGVELIAATVNNEMRRDRRWGPFVFRPAGW